MVCHLSSSKALYYRLIPLQGTQPFGPLDLFVRAPVLIPRPETENWTIRLAELLSPTPTHPVSLLDLGTGTGCIPLLLCHLWPSKSARALGIDISPHAIQLANENASRIDIRENRFKTLEADYLSSNFIDAVEPPYDVVTANPPYIPLHEYVELPRDVKDFEDRGALLAGGPTGLDFYHGISRLISTPGFLSPKAIVALEVGQGQADDVERIMSDCPAIQMTDIWKDPWGVKRTVLARA